nr:MULTISPECIES: YciI family protein [unclassified Pseudomonas]
MNHFYAIFATDKPDLERLRSEIRPRHRQYLQEPHPHRVVVRLGGPTLSRCETSLNGTLLVVEAASLSEAEAFFADDPYVQAGLFERVEIRPWSWGLGNPQMGA